jgi:hypothetical protein
MAATGKSTDEMYGISRIDSEGSRTHAWRVSLQRQGTMHIKNFPDKKHTSKDCALILAKQFRDKILIAYPPTSRQQFCIAIRKNNQTGISGVCTYAKKYQLSDGSVKESHYWAANWPDQHRRSISRNFSVNTYGNDIARQLAIRARAEGLSNVNGVFWASERGVIINNDHKAAKVPVVAAAIKSAI